MSRYHKHKVVVYTKKEHDEEVNRERGILLKILGYGLLFALYSQILAWMLGSNLNSLDIDWGQRIAIIGAIFLTWLTPKIYRKLKRK